MTGAVRWLMRVGLLLCSAGPLPACAQERPAAALDRFASEITAAEASARRGLRADVLTRARRITDAYERDGARSAAEHTSAGRAYVLLGDGNAAAVKAALAAFGVQSYLYPEKKQFLQYTTTSPKLHKVLGVESPVFE